MYVKEAGNVEKIGFGRILGRRARRVERQNVPGSDRAAGPAAGPPPMP
ncbi:hypothetical protein [Burkholderia territorii]|nr:hypothetical protein [Burkholderia territorii]